MSIRRYIGPALMIGGGAAAITAVIFGVRKSGKTVENVQKALSGLDGPPVTDSKGETTGGGRVQIRVTGYWPFSAREDEKKLEGGVKDRKGNPLHTVEDFLAGKAPFVSLSGDDAVWPYGQRLDIPWVDGKKLLGRVVDTGSHFRGTGKLYRVAGYEPIDVCVYSSSSSVPKPPTIEAIIIPGDTLAKKGLQTVATAGLKNQTVSAGIVEGRTSEDYEALARAIESELGGRPREEQVAAAWAMRNRADDAPSGMTVAALLAPGGEYGPARKTGGFCSTRRVPTDAARAVASEVLDASAETDPTGGAVDFWVPALQEKLRALGDVHRAASSAGDAARAKKYEIFSGYGTEGDVRVQQARGGLRPLKSVGAIELLGKG